MPDVVELCSFKGVQSGGVRRSLIEYVTYCYYKGEI
jgi:hypothetical protein